jgi:predicted metallo-beta-lactamase superfamily hydrolase
LLKILKEYLKCKQIIFSIIYVCDVKNDANDNQITYGMKQYPAILLIGKNNIVIINAKIAKSISVIVAKNLSG